MNNNLYNVVDYKKYIYFNLISFLDRACIKTDYKQWSPTAENGPRMPCVLGRKDTFVRRLETRNCYDNRSLIDQPIRSEKCQCEEEDFEWFVDNII